ncbi:MAG: hypothetical protein PHD65_06985 [Gallionella sp.]|nr:hypothetical protein [Gallionella sp.]
MKKNLNDDTRYMRKWEGTPAGNELEWVTIVSLISAILLLGYFILGSVVL